MSFTPRKKSFSHSNGSGGSRPPHKGGRPSSKGGAFSGDPREFRSKFKKETSSGKEGFSAGQTSPVAPRSGRKPFERKGPPQSGYAGKREESGSSRGERPFVSKPFDRKTAPRQDFEGKREFSSPPRGDRPPERKSFDRTGPPRHSFEGKREFSGPPRGDRPLERKSFDRTGPPRHRFEGKREFSGPPRGDRPPERKSFDRTGPPRRSFEGKREFSGPPRGDRPFDRKGSPRGNFDKKRGGSRPPFRKSEHGRESGEAGGQDRSERREGVAPARWNAALALIRVEKGMKIQEAISLAAKLEGPDQALFTELVYGVTRMRRLLDKRLEMFCERPLEETEPEVRTVLRLGLYQSMFLTRIPDYALTSEAVNQVGLLGAPFAMGFVNAVLRRANDAKNKGALPGTEEKTWSLGLRYSHPDWLVERWAKRLTPERLESLLEANNKPHPVYLQVPPERREEAMERLNKAGVTMELVNFPTHTLRVSGPMGPLLEREGLLEGPWVVQDLTFQILLDLVPAAEGARVWDVCAAPGGKTAGLAWRVGTAGQVTATDASADRIKMLRQTVARLGLNNVRILEMEADHFPAAERFQSIWVDAPCSGTGVLSRRADLRWRINASDVDRQAKRQFQILDAAAAHVYPDGFLAYSTCSLEPEENQDIVTRFQKAHPEFETVSLTLPPFIAEVESGTEGLLVWPSADRDGGFLALFHRKM